jgi:hypothetical protein
MTPQEKAKELVNLYLDLMGCAHWNGVPVSVKLNKIMAINCALIAVDEILNNNKILFEDVLNDQYWQEVKQEIQKL